MSEKKRPKPKGCVCYDRGQCAACTLALLDQGKKLEELDTEILRSMRATGVI